MALLLARAYASRPLLAATRRSSVRLFSSASTTDKHTDNYLGLFATPVLTSDLKSVIGAQHHAEILAVVKKSFSETYGEQGMNEIPIELKDLYGSDVAS